MKKKKKNKENERINSVTLINSFSQHKIENKKEERQRFQGEY